jgi:hypothetical protein
LRQKEKRAEEIANKLNDTNIWKSHSRPINRESLRKLQLKIANLEDNNNVRDLIIDYYDLLSDFITTNKLPIFVHTRKYI